MASNLPRAVNNTCQLACTKHPMMYTPTKPHVLHDWRCHAPFHAWDNTSYAGYQVIHIHAYVPPFPTTCVDSGKQCKRDLGTGLRVASCDEKLLGAWPWDGQLRWENVLGLALQRATALNNSLGSGPGMANCIVNLPWGASWGTAWDGRAYWNAHWGMALHWPLALGSCLGSGHWDGQLHWKPCWEVALRGPLALGSCLGSGPWDGQSHYQVELGSCLGNGPRMHSCIGKLLGQ